MSSTISYICVRCARCCRWPGVVRLNDNEVAAIAEYLCLPVAEFTAKYTLLADNRLGLILTDAPNGACVFLQGNACAINPVKPSQCRRFPAQWHFAGFEKLCRAVPYAPTPFDYWRARLIAGWRRLRDRVAYV